MTSKKLIDAYKAIQYWLDGYHSALWYRGRAVLMTDEQRQALRDAEALVMNAQSKIESAFGPAIGKAIMREARK